MSKETCYDCIHQTVCQTHKTIKDATGSPLHPKKAEWFSDLFGLVKDVCNSFKSTKPNEEIGFCTNCGKGSLSLNENKVLKCNFCGQEYF
jgi:hypothetical protein